MNSDSNTLREFDELLEKLCEQQLDDAERARLEDMLRRGDLCRRRYLNYVDLYVTLWLIGRHLSALGIYRAAKTNTAMPVALVSPVAPVGSVLSESPLNEMTQRPRRNRTDPDQPHQTPAG